MSKKKNCRQKYKMLKDVLLIQYDTIENLGYGKVKILCYLY